ncbi:uncharacterized protein [Amphiura filiformis]|uniref:uncharacterized protein n=1 Tax=Amphiura filiformis TaxID=82378 RepID=UPI003B2173C5
MAMSGGTHILTCTFYCVCTLLFGFEQNAFGLTSNVKCPTNWFYYNRHCYILRDYDERLIREEAREACLQMDADLVIIEDGAETAFLSSLLPNSTTAAYWIGLMSNATNRNEFTWLDGTVVRNGDGIDVGYTNWQPGEPGFRPNEYCAEITTENYIGGYVRGAWNDAPCNINLAYICESNALQNDVTTHQAVTWSTADFSTESRSTIIRSGQRSANHKIIIPTCVAGGALLIGITILCFYIRKRSSQASTAVHDPQAAYTALALQSSNTNRRQTAGNPSTRTNTDSSGYQVPNRTHDSEVIYENQIAHSKDNFKMGELNRGSELSNVPVYENPDTFAVAGLTKVE